MSAEKQPNTPSWIADRRYGDSLRWASFKNKNALPLWVADMDFRSPEPVIKALADRVQEGTFGYAKESDRAVEAVVNWLQSRHGWKILPEWIVWVPGVVSAINVVCRAFAEPNEGIFTFTPIYPPFLWSPEVSGRRAVTCPLKCADNRYYIDFDAFESSLTSDTRVVLFCHPHNPVGRVWNKDEIKRLAEVCLRRSILLCSDEIHCDLLLDENAVHIPAATLSEEIADNTITLMSPAKTFNLPGLDCGFAIISNPVLRRQFKKTAQGIVPHINIFGYVACAAAYESGLPWLNEILTYLRQNHEYLYSQINSMPSLSMNKVEATYLAWIDCTGLNPKPNPRTFFENAGVVLMDGQAFGAANFARLNFACSRETLELAVERIKKAVARSR